MKEKTPKADSGGREDDDQKKKTKNNSKQDDTIWKSILEDVFPFFLKFFFPDAARIIDFESEPVFLDKEFDKLFKSASSRKGVLYVDKLAKVKLKDGGEKYVLVHIEVQSRKDYKIALATRLFNYFLRIRDKYKHPITAIVILADNNKHYRPKVYVEEFLGTKLTYEFNSYKIADQNEEALRADPNPFAVVVLTALLAIKHKKANDDQLKDIKHDLYEQMKQRNMPKKMREAIYDFLTYYVLFDNPEYFVNFEQEILSKEGRSTTMGTREYLLEKAEHKGLEKGEIRGEEKKSFAVVENLIVKLGLSDEQTADVAEVTVEFVQKVRASLAKKNK